MAGDEYNTGGLFGRGTRAYTTGQFPSWHAALQRYVPSQLKQAIITGGAAGDHTVTGITQKDVLLAVTRYVGAGVAVTDVADLTSEFTISNGNTINNTGGTNTTGDKLSVQWIARTYPESVL